MWVDVIKLIAIFGFLFFLLPQIKGLLDALAKFISNFGARGKAQVKDIFSIDLSGGSVLSSQQSPNETQYLELLKAYQSPTVTSEEKYIKARIAENGCTNEQAINVLINDLANHRLLFKMVFIDFTIYPEQVKLLFNLNAQAKQIPECQFQRFLDEYVKRSRSFSAKMSRKFLMQFFLLTQHLQNSSCHIIPLCRLHLC